MNNSAVIFMMLLLSVCFANLLPLTQTWKFICFHWLFRRVLSRFLSTKKHYSHNGRELIVIGSSRAALHQENWETAHSAAPFYRTVWKVAERKFETCWFQEEDMSVSQFQTGRNRWYPSVKGYTNDFIHALTVLRSHRVKSCMLLKLFFYSVELS